MSTAWPNRRTPERSLGTNNHELNVSRMGDRINRFLNMLLLFGKGLGEREKSQLIAELINRVGDSLKGDGFEYQRCDQAFQRRCEENGGVTLMLSLGMTGFTESVGVRPMASIRFEVIEDLFHRVCGADPVLQRGTQTVLWQWAGETLGFKTKQLTITRSSELNRAVEFVLKFYRVEAKTFFEQFGTLGAVDKAFNENTAILRSKMVPDWFESLARALIVAKLVGRANYEDIGNRYRNALLNRDSSHSNAIELFDRLALILEEGCGRNH